MADNTQVIQEFLVGLGFKVDENAFKKFIAGLSGTDKAAGITAKSVLGIAVAAEAMVVSFAASMEKLYYTSQRTNASVENLQALEFGSKKIGLAAGQAEAALEAMTAAARMNPGLRSLIDGLLGKDTANLDQAQVMIELVQKLATMPHYQGAQYASMFGMDEKTFLMLKQGLPELIKAEEERRNMNRQANIDAQEAAKAGKEYANSITDITTRLGVLKDKVALELLPTFRDLNKQIVDALNAATTLKKDDVTPEKVRGFVADRWDAAKDGVKSIWNDIKANVKAGRAYGQTEAQGAEMEHYFNPQTAHGKIKYNTTKPPATPAPTETSAQLFDRLEKANGLPAGLLDRVYSKESGRGKYLNSPKGAQGPFQFMPDTSKEYGVKNPYDLTESATATAHKWRDLLKRYNGDTEMAAAAYNWGDGNLQKFGMKNAPFETRDYVASVAGKNSASVPPNVMLTQKTDIHVAGGDNPASTARHVASAQTDVNSAMVRNLRGAVQ